MGRSASRCADRLLAVKGGCLALLAVLLWVPVPGVGQQRVQVTDQLLHEVVPEADRFGPKEGEPPIVRAFGVDDATGGEILVGFAFVTSDYPPQETGYDGPIETLVGLDLQGRITGVRVLNYNESHRRTRGDFLRVPGFQEQFSGKRVTDPFRVRRDVQNLSGATISVQAMTRAIRNASRRVAAAYLVGESGPVTPDDVDALEWVELIERGLADRIVGTERGLVRIELFLVKLRDEAMGRALMGGAYDEALAELRDGAEGRSLWMLGIDGSMAVLFRASDLALITGGDTLRVAPGDVSLTGAPQSERLAGHLRNVGLLAVDPSVDPTRPFTWRLDVGGLGPWTAEHQGEPRAAVAASPTPPPAPTSEAEAAAEETPHEAVVDTPRPSAVAESVEGPAPPVTEPELVDDPAHLPLDEALLSELALSDLGVEEEGTLLARTIESTSWAQFGVMLAAIVLASFAFFLKRPMVRWASLSVTLLALGWGGGGFLSVSHITSGLKVGPGVYAENLTLLLLVVFTVVTTLLWGRVFCGYLCPFGALQDFLERVVPRRWRRKLPNPTQDKGQYVKYGVLGVVVLPALVTENVAVYQFFEPFGTVFFLSPSKLLWGIAISILVVSTVIPRFYCRYVCPLGASLALASLLSPFRIRRVPQCDFCTVCEHDCPTGAIQKEKISFHECVRCNACEVNLKTRAGVCRHDMEKVTQLVQLKAAPVREVVNAD